MKRERYGQVDLGDFLDGEVLPALWERLDEAFPEFGWIRKGNGWTATNRDHTKSLPGAPRPERVVCNRAFGFLVHGGEPTPWAAYVNGGDYPKGPEWVETVRKLAGLAGVSFPERERSPEELKRAEERERRRGLLEDLLAYAQAALRSTAGKAARAYLVEERTFPEDELEPLEFGFYPSVDEVKKVLRAKGYTEDELAAAGVVSSWWTGRLMGPWRDGRGNVVNVWGRLLAEGEGPKYLYQKGGKKASPFGLEDAGGKDLVYVEGILDALRLRAAGVPDVVAAGGASLGDEQIEALRRARVKALTLNLDADEAGKEGTLRALDALGKAPFRVYVVDPVRMVGNGNVSAKVDPDLYVRENGPDAYLELIRTAERAAVYRGEALLRSFDLSTPKGKDEAVDALLEYDERLRDERDREDLWTLAQERTGYAYETLRDLAEGRRDRKTREKLERDLDRLLAASRRDLAEGRTPAETVHELAAELEVLKTAAHVDEPPPFDVDALREKVKTAGEGKVSGWDALDKRDIRFQPAELAVVGGRTGHGKSTFLLGLLLNWLEAHEDETFLLFSYEIPPEAVLLKLASALTRKDGGEGWAYYEIKDWLQGRERPGNYPDPKELEEAFKTLRSWEDRLVSVYRPSWDVEALAAYARKVDERRGNVGAVLVDYLQMVPPPAGDHERRDIEVSAVARTLKRLSVDLAAPVVAAAQINRRSVENAGTVPPGDFEDEKVQKAIQKRRPQLHHLREGGSEQEADLVLGLLNYRADYLEEREDVETGERGKPGPFEVLGLKSRYGELGTARLYLEGRTGTIRDRKPGEK
jgi:DNA primase catalytic core